MNIKLETINKYYENRGKIKSFTRYYRVYT